MSILRHDNYYKRHDDIPFEERAKLNYDHPDAFDTDLLCQHILELKAGKSIEMPVYDYAMHNRSDKTILVHPAPVIVLEGILLFVEKDLCDLMDIKVFVDTDADVRILRRILRDVKERGRSLDSVVTQYLTTVKPMHEQFVEPSKRRADVIIPEKRTRTEFSLFPSSLFLFFPYRCSSIPCSQIWPLKRLPTSGTPNKSFS